MPAIRTRRVVIERDNGASGGIAATGVRDDHGEGVDPSRHTPRDNRDHRSTGILGSTCTHGGVCNDAGYSDDRADGNASGLACSLSALPRVDTRERSGAAQPHHP